MCTYEKINLDDYIQTGEGGAATEDFPYFCQPGQETPFNAGRHKPVSR